MRGIACLLALGLVAATAADTRAATIDREFHKEFQVSPGTVLHLDHGDGSVEITPWDKDVLDVQVRYHAEVSRVGFGSTPDFDVEFRETGKTINVIGRERGGVTLGIVHQKTLEYVYRIQAPPGVGLQLKGEDGTVEIEGWKADIDCELEDGSLRIDGARARRIHIDLEDGRAALSGLEGELEISFEDGTVELLESTLDRARIDGEDGDLFVSDCSGDFQIELEDGDVRMEHIRTGTSRIRTQDGDVDLKLAAAEDVEVTAEDGSVHVGLEEGLSLTFSIRVDDGTTTIDLPGVARLEESGHEITGEWNGGRGQLHVSAEDGDVLLREVRP